MRAFEISDRKDFTAMLFLGTVFDEFQLTSARFDTFAGFTIEGHRNSGYYDSDEDAEGFTKTEYILWKEARPHAFQLIRGKKPPLRFQIVFRYPQDLPVIPAAMDLAAKAPGTALYLNIGYKNQQLTCITGAASPGFIPGFRPDPVWDQAIEDFLKSHGLAFQILS